MRRGVGVRVLPGDHRVRVAVFQECFVRGAKNASRGAEARAEPLTSRMMQHEQFMRLALEQARAAASEGEVPVGAVVVRGDDIVGRGHNRTLARLNATAHAEMLAIAEASAALGSQRLDGCRMYVTLEPCPMCAGAIVNARLDELIFGAFDAKAGAAVTLYSITNDPRLNHRLATLGGVLDAECATLLRDFFAQIRNDDAGGTV